MWMRRFEAARSNSDAPSAGRADRAVALLRVDLALTIGILANVMLLVRAKERAEGEQSM